jgi:hypothetical protein
MRLYEHAVGRISTEDRLELLRAATDLVERRQLSLNALLPFIITDPEHVVVSSAALNFAVLMPLQGGDPLTGPKYLLDGLASTGDSTVQVGVLSALLLLGDRRVVKLLDHCWDGLDYGSKEALTHARSGNLFAAVVEFYLDWLDSLDDQTDGREFGAVTAALTRLPSSTAQGIVVDVKRTFPANSVGDQPEIEVLSEWTVAEFGRRIEPRLRAVHAREREPRITPHVFRAWGLPVPAKPGRKPNSGENETSVRSQGPKSNQTTGSASTTREQQRQQMRHKRMGARRAALPMLAILGVAGWLVGGSTGALVAGSGLLLAAATMDYRTGIVPDEITLYGSGVMVVLHLLLQPERAGSMILGGVLGFCFFYLLAAVSERVYNRPAVGGGVIKMAMLVGVVTGWAGAILSVFLASLLGSLSHRFFKRLPGVAVMYREGYVPFVFYLGIAGLVSGIWGPSLIREYLRLIVG